MRQLSLEELPMRGLVKTCTLLLGIFACLIADGAETTTEEQAELTVWLMPNEPADVNATGNIDADVNQFNDKLAAIHVVVHNTSDGYLKQQLLRWNPEFAVPEWPVIKGQRNTLNALASFTSKYNGNVRLRVLFVSWGHALDSLRRATGIVKADQFLPPPDIAQIGSTWVAYFLKEKRVLVPRNESQTGPLHWRELPKGTAVTLRYIQDVWLLFYWSRLPDESPATREFELPSGKWNDVITALRTQNPAGHPGRPGPPMALPIGYGVRLLHDYVPLIRAGGGEFLPAGSTLVDLVSDQALAIPDKLSGQACQIYEIDNQEFPYRIIAFPEMSHEEALSNHFVFGRYRAMIEPVAFLRRWKEQYDRLSPEQPGKRPNASSFWDHCGVAVPPAPFKGGSDLMVVAGTAKPDLAFELSRFLASDPRCIKLLGEYGNLPAQDRTDNSGMEAMFKELDAPNFAKQKIRHVLNEAIAQGVEYPHLDTFASEIESPEVLEALQRLWRRLAGGAQSRLEDAERTNQIRAAAASAQTVINNRIDPTTRRMLIRNQARQQFLKEYGPFIYGGTVCAALAVSGVASVLLARRGKARREKSRLLEEIRKVRGFAASALELVDDVHNLPKRSMSAVLRLATDKQKRKALMILAGLRGWRRGIDEANWRPQELEQVVWKALLLAIDYIHDPQLFNDWLKSGQPCAAFLKQRHLVRESPSWKPGDPLFFFDVRIPTTTVVAMPLMLEHLLVCLFTNALKASAVQCDLGDNDFFQPVTVVLDHDRSLLSVQNTVAQGNPGFSANLARAINESLHLADFEQQIRDLLKNAVEDWPGIGLVEAYCIATECYGGLTVDAGLPAVNLKLRKAEGGQ